MSGSQRWALGVLIVMVVTEVANLSEVASTFDSAPVFKAVMALGAITLVAALRNPQARARLNRWTVVGAALVGTYFAGQVIAMLDAFDAAAAQEVMWRSVVDLAYLLIILMLIQVTGRPWTVAATAAATVAVLALLTVLNYASGGHQTFGGLALISEAKGELITTARYTGPYNDSNFWGRLLVVGLPLTWALAHRCRRLDERGREAAWLVAGIVMLAGVYLTQSRGTFLAAAIAVGVWFIVFGQPWRLALVPPVVLAASLAPGIGNRMVAVFNDVFASGQRHDVDLSVLAREASQEMAWSMFRERPIFGFGPGSFTSLVPYFTDRIPTAVHEALVAPHNLYAQLLAESGVTGLITWLVLVGGAITIAALRISSNPESVDRALAAATITAIVAWSVASIFLHLAYFRSFAIVLALAFSLGPPVRVPLPVVKKMARTASVWVVAILLGCGAAAATLATMKTPAMQASQKLVMMPAGPADEWNAYMMSIRGRDGFL
ncbi:O-antigen ligase family protein, partial [Mycobacterium sp. CBMA360]|uniref:O-antigen ligase family protein n=4 Tax=Mycolicibacterium TaxID=1866885 RepID=UPI0012DD470B|nr:O-antigen ligase family protein [Mycolicibacterium sp. CBMA 360]